MTDASTPKRELHKRLNARQLRRAAELIARGDDSPTVARKLRCKVHLINRLRSRDETFRALVETTVELVNGNPLHIRAWRKQVITQITAAISGEAEPAPKSGKDKAPSGTPARAMNERLMLALADRLHLFPAAAKRGAGDRVQDQVDEMSAEEQEAFLACAA